MYTTSDNDDIGEALLCSVDIPPNTHFIAFDGVIRSLVEFKVRRDEGKGSYAVGIRTDKVLDCYDRCLEGICKASKANNSLKLVHKITGEKAVKNARFGFNTNRTLTILVSLDKLIPANTEIMYSYGSRYKKKDYNK